MITVYFKDQTKATDEERTIVITDYGVRIYGDDQAWIYPWHKIDMVHETYEGVYG